MKIFRINKILLFVFHENFNVLNIKFKCFKFKKYKIRSMEKFKNQDTNYIKTNECAENKDILKNTKNDVNDSHPKIEENGIKDF